MNVQNISWFTFMILVLASYRLTHLIVFDKITEFIRDPFLRKTTTFTPGGEVVTKKEPTSKFGYLLNCYWCTGIWISAIIVSIFALTPKFSLPVFFVFSIAGAQAILETFVGLAAKRLKQTSKETKETSASFFPFQSDNESQPETFKKN